MRLAYVDTSVLVAIAFAEPSHEELTGRLSAFDRLFACNLLEAEFRSALVREQAQTLAEGFLSPISWVFPDRSLDLEYRRVLEHGYVRGADLRHLACALYLGEMLPKLAFLTLDERQRRVATDLGM